MKHRLNLRANHPNEFEHSRKGPPVITSTQQDIVSHWTLHEQEIRFYHEEGYLYLPGLLSAELAAALREEVLDVLEQSGLSRESLRQASSAADNLRQNGEYLAGSLLDKMVNSPNIRDIVNQLLGGPSMTYYPFTAVKAGGGGGSFHFHQDNQYTPHRGPSNNVWIALNPMTPDNGALCMVPRSHLNGEIPRQEGGDGKTVPMIPVPESYLPMRMNAGDAVVFTRLTVHGSGPNNTSEARVAYALQYHREDTQWYDRATNEWKLLKDNPRFRTRPVDKITRR